jgi:hypothetical protein
MWCNDTLTPLVYEIVVVAPAFGDADLTFDVPVLLNRLASVTHCVWHDLNANGVQDSGEPGIAGVQVTLFGDASRTTIVATNTTVSICSTRGRQT